MRFLVGLLFMFSAHVVTAEQPKPSCSDLSGHYTLGTLTHQGVVVWDFVQTGCHALAMGSHLLKFDGEATEVLEPKILFATAEQFTLCETASCYIISPISGGFEYAVNGMIDVGPNQTCTYEHATMRLDGDRLIRTFTLNDPDPACIKLKHFVVTYHRMP